MAQSPSGKSWPTRGTVPSRRLGAAQSPGCPTSAARSASRPISPSSQSLGKICSFTHRSGKEPLLPVAHPHRSLAEGHKITPKVRTGERKQAALSKG